MGLETRRNNPEGLNANHANSSACSTDVPVHVTFRLRQDEIRNGNLMLPLLGSYACKGLEIRKFASYECEQPVKKAQNVGTSFLYLVRRFLLQLDTIELLKNT